MSGKMFQNATVSSRSSSSRSGNSCSRNSSMPSLRMRSPLSPKTSYNPLFRHSDALTSFDASHFIFQEKRRDKKDRKSAVLRRYNSHDSHTNFCDVKVVCGSKENTPDSTNSRSERTSADSSPESTGDRKVQELEARDFLERYSLPRVVRVEDSEPLLLYRCFDSFTKIQARGILTKKGKEKPDVNLLHFPEGYSGWFSLINEKGERSAVAYSSVLQLVREQVCSFMSIQPFIAYAGHHPDPSETTAPPTKFQYLKTQVKGGQLFQLRAVFQHRDPDGGRLSTKSTKLSKTTRDKDLANRYAQLISQNNQEFYVPLTTKGEFYEIHSSVKSKLCFHGMLDKTGPLALDKDCLYRITHLLRRVALPIRVKLLAGPLPPGLPKDFTDTFILERKFQEPLMVTCTLPAPSENVKHEISCINLNSNVRISRCMLGFDSENRLFKSQRLQAALAFCHKNVEAWYREVRLAPNLDQEKACVHCKSKACNGSCKKQKEDDVNEEVSKQLITKEVLEKFPKAKKWYKHFKILGVSTEQEKFENMKDPMDGMEKVKSIERYKDMSKLIEEKFGKKSYNPVKKSASFMFSTKRIDLEETPTQTKNNPALLKCQSLDTQLFSIEENQDTKQSQWKSSKSNISDSLSYDFQMCILDNDNSLIETNNKSKTRVDLDEIKPADETKIKKIKPDLIPTLTKDDNSFITDRLCSEFHVKTKVQKRSISKHSMLTSNFEKTRGSMRLPETSLSIFDIQIEEPLKPPNMKSVVVQIHENSLSKTKMQLKKKLIEEDIPYSHVKDEVRQKPNGKKGSNENIYAEICEPTICKCDSNSICKCRRKHHSEYCYVKLGSNGDSVTSDSDEAIYNTLR